MLSPRHSSASIGPWFQGPIEAIDVGTAGRRRYRASTAPLIPPKLKPAAAGRASWCGAARGGGSCHRTPGPMHGAAIVPDHEIMRPPDVAIDELRLRGWSIRSRSSSRPPAPASRRHGQRARRDRCARPEPGIVRTSGGRAPFSLSCSPRRSRSPARARKDDG